MASHMTSKKITITYAFFFISVLLLLTVLVVYGMQSDSSAYYVAFDCEIISLILSFFSSLCRFTICRGEKNGPYERIKEKSFRVNS